MRWISWNTSFHWRAYCPWLDKQNVRQRAAGPGSPHNSGVHYLLLKVEKGCTSTLRLSSAVGKIIKKMMFQDVPLSNFGLTNWCKYLKNPCQRGVFAQWGNTSSPFTVYHQPGRFRKHGHTLGFLLAGEKRWTWIFRLFRTAAAERVGIRAEKN